MTGYVRQAAASITAGEDVNAAPLNAEFNALQAAFNSATGHDHSGTTGNAPKINLDTNTIGDLGIARGGTGATDAAGARTNLGLTTVATTAMSALWDLIKVAATTTVAGILEKTTNAEFWAATADKAVTSDVIETASDWVTKSYSGTTTPVWDDGVNFQMSASGNISFGTPTGAQQGVCRRFFVYGNNSSDRTITFSSDYIGPFPEDPVNNATACDIILTPWSTKVLVSFVMREL